MAAFNGGSGVMVSAALKHEVEEVLKQLPETATMHDLLYALETRADIVEGLADADAGRLADTTAVRREYGL